MRILLGRLAISMLGAILASRLLAGPPQTVGLPEPTVAGSVIVETGSPPPPRARTPHRITVGEIQSLALRNAPLADVFETGKPSRLPHPLLDWRGTSRNRMQLLARARHFTVEELRNQNTANALELFWKLAVNLERCRLLKLARTELHSQLGRLDEAIAKELKAPRDRDELTLKISKLSSDELTLRGGLETLQDQLALLVGWEQCPPPAILPASTLMVVAENIDPHLAVQIGLQSRPDLRLLHLLETELDSTTLPLVQKWMTSINPLLGPMQLKGLIEVVLRTITILPLNSDPEVSDVRQQLQQVRLLRERQARFDIQRQVEIIHLKHQDAVQAQRRLEIRQIRLGAVQEKVGKELAADAELGPIRLELWQAEGERLQAAVDWELARIELRKLQGLLTTHRVEGGCDSVAPPLAAPVPQAAPVVDPYPRAFVPTVPGLAPLPELPPVPRQTLPPPLPVRQFPPAFIPSSGASSGSTRGVPGGA